MADEQGRYWSRAAFLPDQAATEALAARIAGFCRAGDVIALEGDLGTGKTVFARAMINAIARNGGAPEEEVPSPTYTLVQIYSLPRLAVYHADLYRVETMEDILELGLEDAFEDGLTLIEWPDRMGAMMPAGALTIALKPGDGAEQRIIEISGDRSWSDRIEAGLADG